ncbi:UNVERIFIED_CONTAM: amino acid adenylation domain-containing protein [Williamsia faeni]
MNAAGGSRLTQTEANAIDDAGKVGRFPLSAAQRGMWFAQELAGDVPIAIAQYVELRGALDVGLLNDCMVGAGKEFGSGFLRLTEEDGDLYQLVDREIDDALTYVDLRDEDDPVAAAMSFMTGEYSAPIDILTDRLVVAYVLQLDTEHFYWYNRIHHVALDGFGAMAITRRVAELYSAAVAGDDPPPSKASDLYGVYLEDAKYRDSERFVNDRAYWAEKTREMPDPPSLSESAAPISSPALVAGGAISSSLIKKLEERAVDLESAVAPLVVAAFATFLARMTELDDIVMSLPVSARTTAALRRSGGMVSNVVPLRLQLPSHATIRDAVSQAQLELTGALRRQRYRYEDIRRDAGETRTRLGLFGPSVNIMLFHNELNLGPMSGHFNVLATGPVEDLALNIYHGADTTEMHIDFEANPQRYEADGLRIHRDRFVHFLELFIERPSHSSVGEIDLVSESERARFVPARGVVGEKPQRLIDLIAEAVTTAGDQPALSTVDGEVSYRDLDAMSNRLARFLIERGIGPEMPVAVALPRSVDYVKSVWAVAKAGGAFLPVDPAYPADRISHILTDSHARWGLTVRELHSQLPDSVDWIVLDDDIVASVVADHPAHQVSDADRTGIVRPDSIAYTIYTSGSTGLPKGVVVSNVGLANIAADMRDLYQVRAGSRSLAVASPSFDASVFEQLLALSSAGTLALAPVGVFGGEELSNFIRAQSITHMVITPAALGSLEPDGLDSLECVISAGEALPPQVAARWFERTRLFNAYGPTETTIIASVTPPITSAFKPTIGAPVRGLSLVVLDDRLRAVPVAVVGELYIVGDGLTRGYMNKFGLTSTRFVASPYSKPGLRMYRTGDLVRWTSSGELQYVGRADNQVKLRGFRIELGEIDAVLAGHPAVRSVVTVVHTYHPAPPERDRRGSDDGPFAGVVRLLQQIDGITLDTADEPPPVREVLVSYVVMEPGQTFDRRALQHFATQQLPPHMTPTSIVVLESLPVTVNGKIDRKALPDPVMEKIEFRAPATVVEQIVATVFGELMGIDNVGLDDDFFALGGNSLIATRAVARLGAELKADVSVRHMFEAPTVEALAARLAAQADSGGRLPLVRRDGAGDVPLSFAQQRMWFLNQFEPDSAAYNIPFAVRLRGRLQTDALRAAVGDLIERHEALRTSFPNNGSAPVQHVHAPGEVVHELVEVRVEDDAEFEAGLLELAGSTFDVSAEVPLRVRLFSLDAEHHVLAMVVHHICADGASMAPLARDVIEAYSARCSGVPPAWTPLPVQYSDYTVWQQKVLGTPEDPDALITRELDFWVDALSDAPGTLDLPTDRPRPVRSSHHGANHDFVISADLHRAVLDLAGSQNATLFMVMHAALAATLAKLAGSDDITIGTPIAGRGEAALDAMVGMFVNTLALRTKVDQTSSFSSLVERVRDVDLAAFSNANIPFERIVTALNPERSESYHPVFQVMLAFQNVDAAEMEMSGLALTPVELDLELAKFDLQLTLTESATLIGSPTDIDARLTFATDLFDRDSVAAIASRFVRMLEAVVADPSAAIADVDVLGSEDSQFIPGDDRPGLADERRNLVELLDAQIECTPDAVAVVADGSTLSYREFGARSHRLARWLIDNGVGPEQVVVVALPRSIDHLVAVHAVLKAGGVYAPVDPDQPAIRNDRAISTSAAMMVLASSREPFETSIDVRVIEVETLDLAGYSPAPVRDSERTSPLRPANAAYMIFTSGSTGLPKGVVVSHSAIVNLMTWTSDRYGIDHRDVVLVKTPATFDVSLLELFYPLQTGARVVIAEPGGHRDPAYLRRLIAEHGVTVTQFVPSMLTVFLNELDEYPTDVPELSSLRMLFAGGEALPAATARRCAELLPHTALHNLYGPTESAVQALFHDNVTDHSIDVPIGRPVGNTGARILDTRLHPAPRGVTGELYLTGVQLARGYAGRADLTADRFVADPYAEHVGAQMYRTGDLVRQRGDGEIIYEGRTDFQVKLRGLRIELGEVESALLEQSVVRNAAVLMRDDNLVGYLVPTPGAHVDRTELRRAMAKLVPAYMIPAHYVVLDQLPLTANGKLDRGALPDPVIEVQAYRPPRSGLEKVVASAYSQILHRSPVGLDDDFFALGGNSLVATQTASRIGAVLGVEIPVRTFFDAPTVGEFASRIADARRQLRPALIARPRPEVIPLALAQQRMWLSNRIEPDSAKYNMPLALRLRGPLDLAALRAAVADVIERHEVLRTIYPDVEGVPRQQVMAGHEHGVSVGMENIEEDRVWDSVVEFVTRPFDVTSSVPLRLNLFRLPDGDHVLAVVVHHIAADGFSLRQLGGDMMAAYAARTDGASPQWDPLPVQYADYALWQRDYAGSITDEGSVASAQLAFWKRELEGIPAELDLPRDRERPATPSRVGASVHFSLDADAADRLADTAQRLGVTRFMIIHSALSVVLSRLSGCADVVIGTAHAGRGAAELDSLVGMLVNTVALRLQLKESEPFTDLLKHAREVSLQAFSMTDVPFESVVDAVSPHRDASMHPIFQTMLSFQNFDSVQLALSGLTITEMENPFDPADFDLMLTVDDSRADGEDLAMKLTYSVDLFDHDTVDTFSAHFTSILTAAVQDPDVRVGDLPLAVIDTPVAEPNGVASGSRGGTVLSLFEASVEADPGAPAMVGGAGETTFAELDARANRLARMLAEYGYGPGQLVHVETGCLREALPLWWAVLKSGAGLVLPATDAELPAKTDLVFGVDPSSEAGNAHADVKHLFELPGQLSRFNPRPFTYADRVRPLVPSSPALLVPESGTWAELSHERLGQRVAAETDRLGMNYESRLLATAEVSPAVTVFEALLAGAAGATVVVPTSDEETDLMGLLADEWVTHVFIRPGQLPAVTGESLEDLQVVISEGNPAAFPADAEATVELMTVDSVQLRTSEWG